MWGSDSSYFSMRMSLPVNRIKSKNSPIKGWGGLRKMSKNVKMSIHPTTHKWEWLHKSKIVKDNWIILIRLWFIWLLVIWHNSRCDSTHTYTCPPTPTNPYATPTHPPLHPATHPYTYPPAPTPTATYPPLHPPTPTPTHPPLHLHYNNQPTPTHPYTYPPTHTHTPIHLHPPTPAPTTYTHPYTYQPTHTHPYTYPPTPTSIHPYPPIHLPPTPTWLGRGRWMQGWVGRCRGGCKWVDVGVGKWVG